MQALVVCDGHRGVIPHERLGKGAVGGDTSLEGAPVLVPGRDSDHPGQEVRTIEIGLELPLRFERERKVRRVVHLRCGCAREALPLVVALRLGDALQFLPRLAQQRWTVAPLSAPRSRRGEQLSPEQRPQADVLDLQLRQDRRQPPRREHHRQPVRLRASPGGEVEGPFRVSERQLYEATRRLLEVLLLPRLQVFGHRFHEAQRRGVMSCS